MSEARRQAVELAQHYFRLIAKNAGATWDDDNATEIEMLVSFIIDAARTEMRDQLDGALERIQALEQLAGPAVGERAVPGSRAQRPGPGLRGGR